MTSLYDTINVLCAKKGINVSILCRETGVSRGTMGDLHTGRVKSLRAENLRRIAEYFGVSIEYLLKGGNEAELTYDSRLDEEVADALLANDDLYDIFFLLKDADEEFIQKALEILSVLVKYEKTK